MSNTFELPVYRNGRLRSFMKIEKENSRPRNDNDGYAEMWAISSDGSSSRKASLLSVKIC